MKSIKINLGRALTKLHWSFHYHTESYYQQNGKCQRCGRDAGMLTPLKIWELVTDNGCKK